MDGRVLWANLHLLFWLSLVPFATGWMGENHFAAVAGGALRRGAADGGDRLLHPGARARGVARRGFRRWQLPSAATSRAGCRSRSTWRRFRWPSCNPWLARALRCRRDHVVDPRSPDRESDDLVKTLVLITLLLSSTVAAAADPAGPAAVPRPPGRPAGRRNHRHRYYGVLAPRARLRPIVTATAGPAGNVLQELAAAGEAMGLNEGKRPTSRSWAMLLVRIYENRPLQCRRCGQAMTILAFILDQEVIERILRSIGEETDPTPRAVRPLTAATRDGLRPDDRSRHLGRGEPDDGDLRTSPELSPRCSQSSHDQPRTPRSAPDGAVCPAAAEEASLPEFGPGSCPPTGTTWRHSAAAASTLGAQLR